MGAFVMGSVVRKVVAGLRAPQLPDIHEDDSVAKRKLYRESRNRHQSNISIGSRIGMLAAGGAVMTAAAAGKLRRSNPALVGNAAAASGVLAGAIAGHLLTDARDRARSQKLENRIRKLDEGSV